MLQRQMTDLEWEERRGRRRLLRAGLILSAGATAAWFTVLGLAGLLGTRMSNPGAQILVLTK